MPALRVDGELLPAGKAERLKRFDELYEYWERRNDALNSKTPYRAKESVWQALKDIWLER